MPVPPLPIFGLVAEGVTDQAVLRNILIGYFAEDGEEPDVRQIQPPPRDTSKDSPDPPGGWGLVFRFFKNGEHRKALQAVDYLVIHIDTDVSEQPGYDVPWREDGRDLTPDELATRVADKIASLADQPFLAAHGHRLVFAIAVHSIECWLLPLLYDDNRASKTTGCLTAANEARRRRNEPPLSKETRGGDSKDHRAYDAVSRAYLKRKKLAQAAAKNPSLGFFLRKLDALRATASTRTSDSDSIEAAPSPASIDAKHPASDSSDPAAGDPTSS